MGTQISVKRNFKKCKHRKWWELLNRIAYKIAFFLIDQNFDDLTKKISNHFVQMFENLLTTKMCIKLFSYKYALNVNFWNWKKSAIWGERATVVVGPFVFLSFSVRFLLLRWYFSLWWGSLCCSPFCVRCFVSFRSDTDRNPCFPALRFFTHFCCPPQKAFLYWSDDSVFIIWRWWSCFWRGGKLLEQKWAFIFRLISHRESKFVDKQKGYIFNLYFCWELIGFLYKKNGNGKFLE